MSWDVTGIGMKGALHKELDRQFDAIVAGTKGTPDQHGYQAAKRALATLIDSAPDGELLQIESHGTADYGPRRLQFEARIVLKLIAPTLDE